MKLLFRPRISAWLIQKKNNELTHHGIKGQKWGVRRFQNEDGSYTPEGKERYGRGNGTNSSRASVKSESYKTEKYAVDRHTITSKGNNKGRSQIDRIASYEDYDSAFDFDFVGQQALQIYSRDGKDAAVKFISEELKDHEYEFDIENDHDIARNEDYLTYRLRLFGASNVYNTAGEEDYSDDQYFSKR